MILNLEELRLTYPRRLDAIETLRHRVNRLLVHQRVTEEETVARLVVQVAGGGELILAGCVADLERAELPVDLEVGLSIGVVDGGIVLLQELVVDEAPSEATLSDAAVAQNDDLVRLSFLLRVRHFRLRQDYDILQLEQISVLRLSAIIPTDTGNDGEIAIKLHLKLLHIYS